MKKTIFNLKELINLRQKIHKYPELSKKEFQTQKRIKEFLLSKGIQEKNIKEVAETGLVVDIEGTNLEKKLPSKIIAFRADIDALDTEEANFDLEYRSTTEGAHLCGHDGHIVTLLGGVTKLLENLNLIPNNRKIRLLFQPAEEKYGGAKRMIEEGVLEGVKEVWGLHNIPKEPKNQVFCIGGPIVSGGVGISLIITGQGGHSSLKKELKDPVFPVAEIIFRMEEYLEGLGDLNNEKIIASFPQIKGSTAGNIIPNEARLNGVCRFFDEKLKLDYLKYLEQIIGEIEKKRGVDIKMEIFEYPLMINDFSLVDKLKEIVEISEEGLPIKFSEDFSEFSKVIPGCFFLYSIGNPKEITLHDPNYNFNDDCIEEMASLWYKIMKNRILE